MADLAKQQPGGSLRRSQRHTVGAGFYTEFNFNFKSSSRSKASGASSGTSDQTTSKKQSRKRKASGQKHKSNSKHKKRSKKDRGSARQSAHSAGWAVNTGAAAIAEPQSHIPKPIHNTRRSSLQSNPDKEPSKAAPAEVPQIQPSVQIVHNNRKQTPSGGSLSNFLAGSRKRKHSTASSAASEASKKSSGKKRKDSSSQKARSGVAAALRSNAQAALVEGLPYYSSHSGYIPKPRSRSRSKSVEKPHTTAASQSAISVDTTSHKVRRKSGKHNSAASNPAVPTFQLNVALPEAPHKIDTSVFEPPPPKKSKKSRKKHKSSKSSTSDPSVAGTDLVVKKKKVPTATLR